MESEKSTRRNHRANDTRRGSNMYLTIGNAISAGCDGLNLVTSNHWRNVCHRQGKGAETMSRRDLTGQRFGRLTVIEDSGKRGKDGTIMWLCKCDCGNTKNVRTGNLISGNTKSCGCLQRELVSEQKTKLIPSGTVFGELTVIKRIGTTNWKGNRSALYLCKCSCGEEAEVSRKNLIKGNTTSCGHKRSELIKKMNSEENMKKKMATWKKTENVENTKLSGISPKRKKAEGKTSKKIGVSFDKVRKLWVAQMIFQRKLVLHSYHKTEQDAIAARLEAEEKYFEPMLKKYGKGRRQ